MEIVIDSHALFWFFSENPKLSRRAEKFIKEADSVIVPSIVLMEILYLLEKHNLTFRFIEILTELRGRRYVVYPLDLRVIIQTLSTGTDLEMHDRIIVATAELFNVRLVSRDNQIRRYYPKTVW